MTNRYCEWKADIVRPHLFVCLHWTAAAMTLPGTRSKQTQERGQRMEEGEANNEHWSMTQALWEHWSSHSRGGGGGGGLSPLSVPQSQIHSWYPPQKRWQWLASGQQPTPTPPTRTHLTIPPELLGVAFPHGWGQASMTHPPLQKKKKHNKEVSQDPACLHNNRKYTSSPFKLLSMTASGLAAKCLLWELIHHYFKGGGGVFNASSHTQYLCTEEKGESSVSHVFCLRNFSVDGHAQRSKPATP